MVEIPATNPELEPTSSIVFEHLFPGNKWGDVTKANPLNLVPLVDYLFTADMMDTDLGKAFSAGISYANRTDIPRPDKMTFGILLSSTLPISEKINRGLINDLIDPDERIGGAGLKHISWLNQAYSTNGFMKVIDQGLRSNTPLYLDTEAYLIGILRPDGKPAGLVTLLKGERKRGIREPKKQIIFGLGRPVLKEIGIST